MSLAMSGILFAGGCLLLFLLSGAETAIIAANRRRFREAEAAGDQAAAGVMVLLGDLRRILVATLAGRTLAVAGAVIGLRGMLFGTGAAWLRRTSGGMFTLADFFALALATPILVVLGEAASRALFRPVADRVVRALPLPMRALSRLVGAPAEWLQSLVRFVLRPVGGAAHGRAYRRGELAQLFNVGSVEAIQAMEEETEDMLDAAGRSMIQNIADLDRTRVREIMRPLVDVVAIRLGESDMDRIRELAQRTGYSKFPVYRTRVIHLEGFISIYDILCNDDPERTRLDHFIQPAYYAPEQMRVNALLQVFLENRLNVAFVVDEYGACSGFVTQEDLFEEIVGDIEDEFDVHPSVALQLEPDGAFLCDGQINVDDLNEALGADFPKEGFETLAGWIYDSLNRVPTPGDKLQFGEFVVEVVEMERVKIKKARIRRMEEEE